MNVNLICRLADDIPPAQILLPREEEQVRNILLVPILDD
jgi:hypothetical protein